MKPYLGSGGTDPHIIDLGTRRWVLSFTPRPLNPGTHRIGGLVGPRASLDSKKNPFSADNRTPVVQPVRRIHNHKQLRHSARVTCCLLLWAYQQRRLNSSHKNIWRLNTLALVLTPWFSLADPDLFRVTLASRRQ
jgi:hypothetical protein